MGRNCLKQVGQCWYQICQIAAENCSAEYCGTDPHDALMERLKAKGKINAFHFAGSCLGAVVDARDILDAVPGMQINWMTEFKDAIIRAGKGDRAEGRYFPAGSIIVDSGVMLMDNSFSRYTFCHEAGHFCMHYPSFSGQQILTARGGMKWIMRRSSVIDAVRHAGRKWTGQDFMENQANVSSLAGAVKVPGHYGIGAVLKTCKISRSYIHQQLVSGRPALVWRVGKIGRHMTCLHTVLLVGATDTGKWIMLDSGSRKLDGRRSVKLVDPADIYKYIRSYEAGEESQSLYWKGESSTTGVVLAYP